MESPQRWRFARLIEPSGIASPDPEESDLETNSTRVIGGNEQCPKPCPCDRAFSCRRGGRRSPLPRFPPSRPQRVGRPRRHMVARNRSIAGKHVVSVCPLLVTRAHGARPLCDGVQRPGHAVSWLAQTRISRRIGGLWEATGGRTGGCDGERDLGARHRAAGGDRRGRAEQFGQVERVEGAAAEHAGDASPLVAGDAGRTSAQPRPKPSHLALALPRPPPHLRPCRQSHARDRPNINADPTA
jgi:hypothetical protein